MLDLVFFNVVVPAGPQFLSEVELKNEANNMNTYRRDRKKLCRGLFLE